MIRFPSFSKGLCVFGSVAALLACTSSTTGSGSNGESSASSSSSSGAPTSSSGGAVTFEQGVPAACRMTQFASLNSAKLNYNPSGETCDASIGVRFSADGQLTNILSLSCTYVAIGHTDSPQCLQHYDCGGCRMTAMFFLQKWTLGTDASENGCPIPRSCQYLLGTSSSSSSSSSSSGSSGTASACSKCLDSCRGISGCCCGSGCICDSDCTDTCQ